MAASGPTWCRSTTGSPRLIGATGSSRAVGLATEVLRLGAPVGEIGTVVVHLPGLLGRVELRFLEAVAERTPVHVLLGVTGSPDDEVLAQRFAALGAPSTPPEPSVADVVTEVLSANDIDDEVRGAVRRLLHHAEAGDEPVPLHRMALVHPVGSPYAGIVAEVLRSAGIPFSGPSPTTLAQSAPGRVLLGVLDVAGSGFGRQEVIDLWSTGLVFDDAGVLPFARFDEVSRRLGVVGGLDRWRQALAAADEHERARAGTPDDDGDVDGAGGAVEARRAVLDHLGRSLDVLDELCQSMPSAWADVAGWGAAVLDRLCGPLTRRGWPDHELNADTVVRTALGRLHALAAVEEAPSGRLVRETIATVLDTPAPRRAGTGHGLLVTTPEQPPVTPLDAVAVVGLAEGSLPRTVRDDVLLGEAVRRSAGLAVAEDRHLAQRRGFRAALASAAALRVLTYARNDQRSGRSLVPSRWLLEVLGERSGERPRAEDLMAGRPVEGVQVVPSPAAGLEAVAAGRTAALDGGERALAALVAAGSLDGHPAAGPTLAPGVLLARSRRARAFTRFDGDLGGHGVDVTAMGVLSPTSIETYAGCPRRWFFGHVLGLGEVDRPEAIDRIQPRRSRHAGAPGARAVLRRGHHRRPGPCTRARLVTGAAPAPRRHRRRGVRRARGVVVSPVTPAGGSTIARRSTACSRPRWSRDTECRAALGTRPVAVEFTFGRRGQPPLEIDLGDGRIVRLAGQADRVDRAGRTLHVWDYKYSGGGGFRDLVKDEDKGGDPLLGGTKIQLVAYATAAGERYDVDTVYARYWLLRPDVVGTIIGYEVDDALRERFRRVLGVVADGIAAGRFPARPGDHQWHLGNFANCTWCEFDAICPGDRDVEWQRVRIEPSLARYVRLAEEGSATVVDQAPERARLMSDVLADQDARDRIAGRHGHTLFVEAGAGSGKTSALVSRLVSLVVGDPGGQGRTPTPGVDVESIAAITFTEAAAAELRARVRQTLEDVAAGHPVRQVVDTARRSPCRGRRARPARPRHDLHAARLRPAAAAGRAGRGRTPAFASRCTTTSARRCASRSAGGASSVGCSTTMRWPPPCARRWRLGIGTDQLQVLAAMLGQNWDLVEEAQRQGQRRCRPARRRRPVDAARRRRGSPRSKSSLDSLVRCRRDDDRLLVWITRDVRAAAAGPAQQPHRPLPHLAVRARRVHRQVRKQGQSRRLAEGDGKAETAAAATDHRRRPGRRLASSPTPCSPASAASSPPTRSTTPRPAVARDASSSTTCSCWPARCCATHRDVRAAVPPAVPAPADRRVPGHRPAPDRAGRPHRRRPRPRHRPRRGTRSTVEAGRLFFVGDPKQSIYRFRRADIDLFSRTARALRRRLHQPAGQLPHRRPGPAVLQRASSRRLIAPATDTADEHGRVAQPDYVPLLEQRRPPFPGAPGPPWCCSATAPPTRRRCRPAGRSADVAAVLGRAHAEGW